MSPSNWPRVWRVGVLLGFAVYILVALLTGTIERYVHPTFVGWQWLAAITLLLFAGIQATAPELRHVRLHPVIVVSFLLPILLGVFLQPTILGADAIDRHGLSMYVGDRASSRAGSPLLADDPIVVTNQSFVDVMMAIAQTDEDLEGRAIEMTGFLAKSPLLAANEMFLARLVVSCHVAHAQAMGLIVIADQIHRFQPDDWVTVTGTLRANVFLERTLMKIEVDSITPIPMPINPYVFAM